MGNILESSWGIFIKTIEQLNLLFSSPTRDRVTDDTANPQNDLKVVTFAISSLWQSTVHLEVQSVAHVLKQLVMYVFACRG